MMDTGQATSSEASELRPLSASSPANALAIAAEKQAPSGEAALPESFNAGSAELSTLDQLESRVVMSDSKELHAVENKPAATAPGSLAGQNEGGKKGTSLQSTLDAGAQAFGSVRAVVAKNLAALQATRDADKKLPDQTAKAEPLLTSTQSQPKVQGTEGKSMSSSNATAPSEKQSFGSGLSFASLGSRFQSLKQTAVKAVSQPVRHLVSQNKRRYMVRKAREQIKPSALQLLSVASFQSENMPPQLSA